MVSKSLFLMLTPAVLAKTIQMNVGDNNGNLVFQPDSITASVGDMVEFAFYPRDHSVVQGDYSNACQPLSGGFYSGYFPVSKGPGAQSFTVTINSTDPIWLYCSQGAHCQSGMVGVINPPASGDTLDAYKAASAKAENNKAGPQVQGGVVGNFVAASLISSSGVASTSGSSSATMTGAASTTITSGTSRTTVPASGTSTAAGANTASATTGTLPASTSAKSGAMGTRDSKSGVMAAIVALSAGLCATLLLA